MIEIACGPNAGEILPVSRPNHTLVNLSKNGQDCTFLIWRDKAWTCHEACVKFYRSLTRSYVVIEMSVPGVPGEWKGWGDRQSAYCNEWAEESDIGLSGWKMHALRLVR